MSVYTAVDTGQLGNLLRQYALGSLKDYQGIAAGIENTNYCVRTSTGEFVLTIFEHVGIEDLQFDLQLMEHLATAEIPSPLPLHRLDGELLSSLAGKPAALLSRLSGRSPKNITPQHCAEIGRWLARLHVAGQDFPLLRHPPRNLVWAETVLNDLKKHISSHVTTLLTAELEFQKTVPRQSLPQGIIHSDLFSDNVLFTGNRLTGLLDLYDASVDAWLYDIAVTANAWCSLDDGCFDQRRLQPLLQAYAQIRPLTDDEYAAWPAMTRAAALRFWLSRLHHREFQRPGELTQIKPPKVYENILQRRQSESLLCLNNCG